MKRVLLRLAAVLVCLAECACRSPQAQPTVVPDSSFLKKCAFVCVDIQPRTRTHVTDEQLLKSWTRMGITADDVNTATDYAFDVAYPNARRVADACRSLGLPMIFIHWGCLFKDGMDLDPKIRQSFLSEYGPNFDKWGHRLCDPTSRPAEFLGVRDGEYVIPKTGQDAFTSSNIRFVLTNLGVANLVFVGGHTGACLGKTAQSAKRLGFHTLCIEDATFDARESTRVQRICETDFDYIITTEEFLALVQRPQVSVNNSQLRQPARIINPETNHFPYLATGRTSTCVPQILKGTVPCKNELSYP